MLLFAVTFHWLCYFVLFQTVRHGFPYLPTALAFDPVQKILAIGTRTGAIRMYPFLFRMYAISLYLHSVTWIIFTSRSTQVRVQFMVLFYVSFCFTLLTGKGCAAEELPLASSVVWRKNFEWVFAVRMAYIGI